MSLDNDNQLSRVFWQNCHHTPECCESNKSSFDWGRPMRLTLIDSSGFSTKIARHCTSPNGWGWKSARASSNDRAQNSSSSKQRIKFENELQIIFFSLFSAIWYVNWVRLENSHTQDSLEKKNKQKYKFSILLCWFLCRLKLNPSLKFKRGKFFRLCLIWWPEKRMNKLLLIFNRRKIKKCH